MGATLTAIISRLAIATLTAIAEHSPFPLLSPSVHESNSADRVARGMVVTLRPRVSNVPWAVLRPAARDILGSLRRSPVTNVAEN